MSIRGTVTLECDRKNCHAELVIDANADANIESVKWGLNVELAANDWVIDDNGDLWCPDCAAPDERDEAYERAAARDRLD